MSCVHKALSTTLKAHLSFTEHLLSVPIIFPGAQSLQVSGQMADLNM